MANIQDLRSSIIDLYLEMVKPDYTSKLEPFEVYAERVKAQVCRSQDEFVSHLQHGYEVILKKISEKM